MISDAIMNFGKVIIKTSKIITNRLPKNMLIDTKSIMFRSKFPQIHPSLQKKYNINIKIDGTEIIEEFTKGVKKLIEIFFIEKDLDKIFHNENKKEGEYINEFLELKSLVKEIKLDKIIWKYLLYPDKLSQKISFIKNKCKFMILTITVLTRLYNFCVEEKNKGLHLQSFEASSFSQMSNYSIDIDNFEIMKIYGSLNQNNVVDQHNASNLSSNSIKDSLTLLQLKVMKIITKKRIIKDTKELEMVFLKHMYGKEFKHLVKYNNIMNVSISSVTNEKVVSKFKKEMLGESEEIFYQTFSNIKRIINEINYRFDQYTSPNPNMLIEDFVKQEYQSKLFDTIKNLTLESLVEVYEFFQVIRINQQLKESLFQNKFILFLDNKDFKSKKKEMKTLISENNKNKNKILNILTLFSARYLIPELIEQSGTKLIVFLEKPIGEVIKEHAKELIYIEEVKSSKQDSEVNKQMKKNLEKIISEIEFKLKFIPVIIETLLK